ncbi:potassium channel subfamily K member 1 isoform X2 [Sitodiplosis mosellana]|uniref:potassium channel subfamily K member 1 isoform X2 n=1 Tax=Sitodiplosis mosellana TaxID=263140 RepID=UPI0024445ED7|nr:potassium channel subfamily K member 1 isoform X2 [Sitodiplosis mosellana]
MCRAEMANNKDEEGDEGELLEEQLKVFDEIKKRSTFRHRFFRIWKSLKLRSAFGHFGLMISLSIYCVVGGVIFRSLEAPAEEDRTHKLHMDVMREREYLVGNITKLTTLSDLRNLDRAISLHLEKYESVAEDAVQGGITLSSLNNNETFPYTKKWNIVQAIFFSSTVLTTIGYGNVAPITQAGRAFCMGFALIGIPFTLTVIADLGRVFATAVSAVGKKLPSLTTSDSTSSNKKWLYALASVCFLGIYLGIGAAILLVWEKDWGFFEGFYFCFITMTTIGFGDLFPENPTYMLWCTVYILVGLALTSTIIELVRRQYAESWQRIQDLSFADTLRRMQLGGGGLDVSALQNDIRRVLTVSRRGAISGASPHKKDDADNDQEIAALAAITGAIMEEVKKSQIKNKHNIIQIVIYESSV